MPVARLRITVLLILALTTLAAAGTIAAQSPSGGVRGSVVDSSDGVLPGVVVVAVSAEGRPLGSAVTDARGEFAFDGLAAGNVSLSFQLSGFEPAVASVTVQTGAPATYRRTVHRLALQTLAESVTVRGAAPLPPPPPPPVVQPVPDHDQVAVCGPSLADAPVPSLGTIRSRHDDETKVLFASGDQLLIDGGATTGLAVGQNFVVRRRYPTSLRFGRNVIVVGEHSSGLVQLVDVEADVSTAVVVYACDEMMRGDYLSVFEPEPVRVPEPVGAPMFDRAARILFADEGQPLGVPGRMLVLDRGSRDDVRVGQRMTIFRRSRFRDARPLVVGDAVVVAVRKASATIRIERATDVIFFGDNGDWAAPQRPMAIASH